PQLAGSGAPERAIARWLKAGRRSVARSAHSEAIAYFGQGLSLLGALPGSHERDAREIELRLASAASFLATKGIASQEAVEAYARARDVAEQRNDTNRLIAAMWACGQPT